MKAVATIAILLTMVYTGALINVSFFHEPA